MRRTFWQNKNKIIITNTNIFTAIIGTSICITTNKTILLIRSLFIDIAFSLGIVSLISV